MYRMSEKQTGICQRFRTAIANKFWCRSPTLSRTFHQTQISWLFYHFSSCFVSFYIIFGLAVFFQVNLRFQREKKLRGNVVFTTTAIRICFALLAVIFKLPFIWRISLKTKMSPFLSQMLAFSGHPFYFDYQDFISLASDFISTF